MRTKIPFMALLACAGVAGAQICERLIMNPSTGKLDCVDTTGTAAPVDAKYIVQQADATLTAEQALGALSTGLMKVTTTTGVVSTAVAV